MSVGPARSPADAPLPSGTVTFVFTDIEGSTVRWDRDRAAMQDAVRRHDAIMRAAIAAHNGHVFKTIGDAFCAAFSRPEEAVGAMLAAQRALGGEDFAAVDGLRVRMAIHTGTADERDGDYFGPAVNRVARLLSIAHGGQVLLAGVTSDLVQSALPSQVSLRDLGMHRLKDLSQLEHVRQLVAPDIATEFPPLRSLNALANNLPAQLTSFIGRETEIAEITALLGKHRLVTLVGSGGVGKTRTSLQVAANEVDGRGDGVWLIELAPLRSGDGIPNAIAQAIGITLGDGDPLQQLIAALKAKNMLLVLDNCEHIVEAVARVVAALLRGCPQVTILASSREVLKIEGEAAYRVPSLAVPAAPAGGADLTVEDVLAYPGVALFLERARVVNSRFEFTAENAPIVADICRRLDGIPLAIELAAARVKMLSPGQLRARLDERFRLLTGGSRDRLPRQQTLRALIDWSYDLLDAREQLLLRRLGIFLNGFTLEAATAVAAGDELDEFAVFDLLTSLDEKSLVMIDAQGESVRYRLLESTRAYALEKLVQAGEETSSLRRHLHYFCELFRRLAHDAEQMTTLYGRQGVLELEYADVRYALDAALIRGDVGDGAKLLASIGNSWFNIGRSREGIELLQAFGSRLPRTDSRLLAELGTALTFLYANRGELAQAREAGSAAVAGARLSGHGATHAAALTEYALTLIWTKDLSGASDALREAQAIGEASPRVGRKLLEYRAQLHLESGNLDAAEAAFLQLRELWRSCGQRSAEVFCIQALGEVAFRRGHFQRSVELIGEAVEIARGGTSHAYFLVCWGSALAIIDALSAARTAALDAIAIWAGREPEHADVAQAIELLAYVCAARGDADAAARLAGYADASIMRIGLVRDPLAQAILDRLMPLLHGLLAPDDLAHRRARGAALTADAAITLARTPAPGAALAFDREIDAREQHASE